MSYHKTAFLNVSISPRTHVSKIAPTPVTAPPVDLFMEQTTF